MAKQSHDRNEAVGKLFEYDNFRVFLKDYFEEEKRLRPAFSQRWFAQKAGFKSTGFCSLIVSGARKLGDTSIPRLVEATGLVGVPAEFLDALIRYNQAGTLEGREAWFALLKRLRMEGGRAVISSRQFPFWERWYHVAIRELAVHSDWKGDYSRLAGLVRPKITSDEAKESVRRLEEVGLLVCRPDGAWEQAHPVVSGEGTPPALLREFKREMTLRALEAMDSLPPSKRHFSTSTFSVSLQTYRILCERIDRLRSEILQIATDEAPEIVLQANFQVFPISAPLQKSD